MYTLSCRVVSRLSAVQGTILLFLELYMIEKVQTVSVHGSGSDHSP